LCSASWPSRLPDGSEDSAPHFIATILSAALNFYLFLAPEFTFARPEPADTVFLAIFVLEGTAIAGLSELMHRARERAERSAETARREAEERERIASDLRESVRREQESRIAVESASRVRDEFLSTVSHGLRTPLNSILGWSQILRMGDLAGVDKEAALESIERGAQHQARLIDDLLDVSRIINGRLTLNVQPTDAAEVIGEVVARLRPTANAKGVDLDSELQPVGEIMADSERLQQIVWNIVANAIKFTPSGGRVFTRLTAGVSRILITVSDTGEGITPEILPFVFERLRQGTSSTTRLHGGMGMGLAIVRHLVELHGGTVSAESAGKDKGSLFKVELPVQGGEDQPRVRAPGENLNGKSANVT
jgi:signal transduction histidine kinase